MTTWQPDHLELWHKKMPIELAQTTQRVHYQRCIFHREFNIGLQGASINTQVQNQKPPLNIRQLSLFHYELQGSNINVMNINIYLPQKELLVVATFHRHLKLKAISISLIFTMPRSYANVLQLEPYF